MRFIRFILLKSQIASTFTNALSNGLDHEGHHPSKEYAPKMVARPTFPITRTPNLIFLSNYFIWFLIIVNLNLRKREREYIRIILLKKLDNDFVNMKYSHKII